MAFPRLPISDIPVGVKWTSGVAATWLSGDLEPPIVSLIAVRSTFQSNLDRFAHLAAYHIVYMI